MTADDEKRTREEENSRDSMTNDEPKKERKM
jgi:hypothetical protein